MMRSIPTTAVIAVAGYGTRMLPITKSIEKCMLPVLNRPVVDYIVEDCIKSGIKKIIFIVGEDHYQLQTYYGDNDKLYSYLASRNKHKELAELQAIGKGLEFIYIVQPANGQYGTAIPLKLAKDYLNGHESFVYLMGDDFFDYKTKPSTAKLIEEWLISGDSHGLIGAKMPDKELYRYGVLDINSKGQFKKIVEKPSIGQAPSNYINVARYIFSNSIFKFLDDIKQNKKGEYYITDVVNTAIAAGEIVFVCKNDDEWLDCGNLDGWLKANNYLYTRYS